MVSRPRRGSGSAFTSDLEADDPEAEVRRLVDRGAVVVEQHEEASLGMAWTVLRIPRATTSAFQPQARPPCSATPFNPFRRPRRKRQDNDSAELCVVTRQYLCNPWCAGGPNSRIT